MPIFNPVEKNLAVSLYGINVIPNSRINIQFSVDNLENIIEISNANIDGRLTDLNENSSEELDLTGIGRKRYVAMLSESTASVSIFPKQRYASFFLSTCGSPNPVLSLDPLISLFLPMKAEVRIFTSSSISSVLGALSADEEEFWSRFDEQRVPYFYTMKSAEKDKNGIYFNLFSELHELKPIPLLDDKSSPVEKIMIVSMYDSDMAEIRELSEKCSLPELEGIIEETGNKVIGRMSKIFKPFENSDIDGFSYVGMMDKGQAAYHVTPEHAYSSFYISGYSDTNPYRALKPLLSLFSPQKAEVRIIGSSPLDKIDQISYRDSANFWEEFQKEEIPSSFQINNPEKTTKELYFELGQRIKSTTQT